MPVPIAIIAVPPARIPDDPDRIYVRDKNVYTSAGVTAGIDLALALSSEQIAEACRFSSAEILRRTFAGRLESLQDSIALLSAMQK